MYYEARLFVLGVSHAWITPHGISPSLIITTDMQTFRSLETTFKLKQPHEFNATCVSRLMICDKGTLHRAAHRDQLHMQNHSLYHLLQVNWPSLLGRSSPLPHCCQTTPAMATSSSKCVTSTITSSLGCQHNSLPPSPLQKGLAVYHRLYTRQDLGMTNHIRRLHNTVITLQKHCTRVWTQLRMSQSLCPAASTDAMHNPHTLCWRGLVCDMLHHQSSCILDHIYSTSRTGPLLSRDHRQLTTLCNTLSH